MRTIKRSDIEKYDVALIGIDPGMRTTAIVVIGAGNKAYSTEYQKLKVLAMTFTNNIYAALSEVDFQAMLAGKESVFVVEDSRGRSGKKEAAYGAGAVNAITTAIVQILDSRQVTYITRKAGGRANRKLSKELVYSAYGVKLANQHEADAFMCAIREVQII